jgi:hypothetical protein
MRQRGFGEASSAVADTSAERGIGVETLFKRLSGASTEGSSSMSARGSRAEREFSRRTERALVL